MLLSLVANIVVDVRSRFGTKEKRNTKASLSRSVSSREEMCERHVWFGAHILWVTVTAVTGAYDIVA